jgi:hypothetical protein
MFRTCGAEETAERATELSNVVQSFFKASLDLHSQNPALRSCWRQSLLESNFQLGHKSYRPHRALRLKEDEDDGGVDAEKAGFLSRKIDLAIEPVILRYGDAEGNDMEHHRVVHKAVVWMIHTDERKEDMKKDDSGPTRQAQQHNTPTRVEPSSAMMRNSDHSQQHHSEGRCHDHSLRPHAEKISFAQPDSDRHNPISGHGGRGKWGQKRKQPEPETFPSFTRHIPKMQQDDSGRNAQTSPRLLGTSDPASQGHPPGTATESPNSRRSSEATAVIPVVDIKLGNRNEELYKEAASRQHSGFR